MNPYLFIITARGGSKGLPRKNIIDLGGKPLIAWTIAAIRGALPRLGGEGHRIICSTEDSEIAQVAIKWGGEVPFMRPAELASDTAKSVDVVIDVLDKIGDEWKAVILVQPTSPFLSSSDVVNAIEMYGDGRTLVMGVCRNEHPIEWNYRMSNDGSLKNVLPCEPDLGRQRLPASYRSTGAIYVWDAAEIRKSRTYDPPNKRGFVMPPERSVDIDTIDDLNLAQQMIDRGTIKQ